MSSFISKIACLLLFCFVLGNAFAQQKSKTWGFVIDKTKDLRIDYCEMKITVLETGEVVTIDSIGRFYFSMPDNLVKLGLNIKTENFNKDLFLDDLDNMIAVMVKFDEEGVLLSNRKMRTPPICEKGIHIENLPTYNPIQRRNFPTFTYFNKAMGM